MNYKFLSFLVLIICMRTSVKADVAPEAAPKAAAVLKIGYVDVGYVLEQLPEAKKRGMDLTSFEKQMENQVKSKHKEFQEKMASFQEEKDKLTQAQQNQRHAELAKLQEAVQELYMTASHKMQQKHHELMEPLHARMREVIRKVAEEGSYTFVFSKEASGIKESVLLFAQKSFDLSDLVLERLKKEAPLVVEAKPPVVGARKDTKAAAKAATEKKK
ncbi:MAG: OmpH family outer membrane protein [Candidatus Cardinium sp.]|nr:OmpH family outer membrane protein [Candidatus Cardinium sp.]